MNFKNLIQLPAAKNIQGPPGGAKLGTPSMGQVPSIVK